MGPTTKIIIGALAAALLAGVAHGPLNLGRNCCGKIEAAAQAAVAPGITATIGKDPLSRHVVLSGDVTDPAAREAALNAVRAVPGVASASWADDGNAAAVTAPVAAAPEVAATAEVVASCQADVDATIKGKTIKFATAKADLLPESAALVAMLASALKACSGTTVEVAGHTDRTGNAAANQTLSEARADAVVAVMVSDGVPGERLVAKGFGATKLVDDGYTPVAHAANRRIEFAVASRDAAPAAPAAQ